MKAVELFAGIGGFRVACEANGIDTIWANDIDPKASQVYRSRFGSTGFFEGDITGLIHNIPDHDILTGGFPCQPFSSAGKKLGLGDSRGTLFEKISEVIKDKNPKYFVLENVKRLLSMDNGKSFATILDSLTSLGYMIEWRLLNAKNFGLPQNRERIIIVGHKNSEPSSYLCTSNDLDELTQKQMITLCSTSLWKEIEGHGAKFLNWGMAIKGHFCHADVNTFSDSLPQVKLEEVIEQTPDKSFFFTEDTLKRIENSEKVDRYFNEVEILYNQRGGARMGYSIFGTSGLAPTLTCTTSRHYERYKVGNEYRRLTNVEYARIQGFSDNHCNGISIYDQYQLFGNAVPPQMIAWVISRLINSSFIPISNTIKQATLL